MLAMTYARRSNADIASHPRHVTHPLCHWVHELDFIQIDVLAKHRHIRRGNGGRFHALLEQLQIDEHRRIYTRHR